MSFDPSGSQRERAHLAAIIESSDDAILSEDLDGTLRSWNRGAERMFGYTAGEIVGRPVSLLVPAERREEEKEILARISHGERVEHYRTRRRRKDGSEVDVSLTASPIRDEAGAIIGASSISRDITRQIAIEAELARQSEELRRSNAELERFAYVASHDLQEPLRMVSSYVQLLARRYQGRLDADADEFIHYAVDGASRMRRLIQDLLTYARISTRGEAFEPVALEEVLEDTREALKVAIEESGATLTHDPLPTVTADPTQMGQLFQNLLSNALKFRGAEPPVVHIGARRSGDHAGAWLFSVHDNGIGIDPAFFDRIFIVFQRLHGMTEYSGTGIGLALCRRIVERHGGHLWVESGPGRGATFFFTLPDLSSNNLRSS
jgi:PAS domain S-box-containing protein